MKINIPLNEYKELINSKSERNFFKSKMDALVFKVNDEPKDLSSSINNDNKPYDVHKYIEE